MKNQQIKKGYMVYKLDGGNSPRCIHDSRADAMIEAKRLAKQNFGETFIVLEFIAAYKASSPIVRQVKIASD